MLKQSIVQRTVLRNLHHGPERGEEERVLRRSTRSLWCLGNRILISYYTEMKTVHIQQTFFLGLLVFTTGIFLWMLGEFLMPVLWAAIVTLVFYPFYQWLWHRTGERASLASLVTIGALIVAVLGPLILLGGLIVQDSFTLYERVSQEREASQTSLWQQAKQVLLLLEPYGITERDVTERIQEWTATIAQSLSGSAVAFSQVTFKFFVQIGVMVYLLFFFFRDGPKLLHVLKEHLPLERAYGDRLLTRFAETTRAIIKGTLTVSILQGVIIGFTFWLTGITSPVLWGVAVAVLALIPALGAALVWVPAGLVLLFTGSVWGGIVSF